ncbi:DnaJ domain-containing protein [Marinobacter daepoensis]|uniref:DnaJ domain-containing protein n=1 Tax=Marinobacter daepoensis TaxID=262077 RepID=UPI001C9459D1|nr:DnaJ domain-containing protein [Marinobacter daepoensis]MBY6033861.1 DnaJ domain-containing protein [Marinobacter daepoensis]
MQLILGLALTAAVFVILKKWGALSPEGQKAAIWKVLLVAGGALLLFMVLTGRVHVLTAGIAALIPLIRKLPVLFRHLPWLRRALGATEERGAGQGQQQAHAAPAGAMSEREACDILGVQPGCSSEEVVAAHRRLMLKVHPDRGGNDYLAAKLNEARDVLLGR